MKVKFVPLVGFLLLAAGLIYAGWLAITRVPENVNAHDILAYKQNSTDFKVPSREEIDRVQDLSKKLILIANPKVGTPSGVDLKLFGEKKIVRQVVSHRTQSKKVPKSTYKVTFTFVSDQNQYCYINNKFYQKGDVMPDGGSISRIEPRRVLITKNNIAEWVPVTAKSASSNQSRQGK